MCCVQVQGLSYFMHLSRHLLSASASPRDNVSLVVCRLAVGKYIYSYCIDGLMLGLL